MAFKISTGLQTHLLTTGSLKDAVDDLVFKIYGSPTSQAAADALVPDEADDSVSAATLLCIVSVDSLGTGVSFDATPVSGALYKTSSETWTGDNVASGYASFYRLEDYSDDGSASDTAIRGQGSVGTINADLIVASAYLTLGEEQRIDSYAIGLPTE